MPSVEAGGVAAAANGNAVRFNAVRFIGRDVVYWRILVRGAVLLMITLGIYRFWLATDTRRFLWANTEIDGESLEYSGTAIELLLGFLIAVVLLVPIYTIFFVTAFDLGDTGSLLSSAAFLLLVMLTQFAIYRARDYRLTRTVFRGLRFHQTGSGWRYAVCAVLWWGLTLLTFGIAYPFARASLERFKMRHTFYGDLPGRFEASGFWLFVRGMPIWFFVIMPAFATIGALLTIDWPAVVDAAGRRGDDTLARMEASSPGFFAALGFAIVSFTVAATLALVLFPAFQALVLRWWASGIRFGDIDVLSRLRTGDVYRAYLRFVGYVALFALIMLVGSIVVLGVTGFMFGTSGQSKSAEIAVTAMLVGIYVVSALGLSTIYQATAKLAIWKLTAQSLELSDGSVLQRVRAAGEAASPLGEGLADALNVGGL